MKQDVAPPYTAVARHAVFPEPSHDEAARFDFLANFNKYLSGTIGAGNKQAYDTRVLPAFVKEHGREPADRSEIRRAMNREPWHRFWSGLKRNSMEMRQQNGRQMVLRQIDELDAQGRAQLTRAARRSNSTPQSRCRATSARSTSTACREAIMARSAPATCRPGPITTAASSRPPPAVWAR